MSDLYLLAYHYGGGWTDWLGHMALSAVIHALIYSVIFRMIHDLTLGQAVVVALVVLAAIFLWGRARDRRGW